MGEQFRLLRTICLAASQLLYPQPVLLTEPDPRAGRDDATTVKSDVKRHDHVPYFKMLFSRRVQAKGLLA